MKQRWKSSYQPGNNNKNDRTKEFENGKIQGKSEYE